MAPKTGRLRVGTSGYQYGHWRGSFYPAGLPKRAWFDHYARHFDCVEINNTFYRLPAAATFERWRAAAPEGFEYALKFSRYGSHIKRLNEPEDTIRRFLEVAERLGPCLGPILVQLPPGWRARPERLDGFLRVAGGSHRWLFEFRDPDWLRDEVFDVLRAHRAALCIHDMIARHPRVLTADWTCLRFHGDCHAGRYSTQFLVAEADRIAALLRTGHDVHVFFNNDAEAHAVHNALDLRRHVEARVADVDRG